MTLIVKDECSHQSSSVPSLGPKAGCHFNCFTVCASCRLYSCAFPFIIGDTFTTLSAAPWRSPAPGRLWEEGKGPGKHPSHPRCLLPQLTCDPDTGTFKGNGAGGYNSGQMQDSSVCVSPRPMLCSLEVSPLLGCGSPQHSKAVSFGGEFHPEAFTPMPIPAP